MKTLKNTSLIIFSLLLFSGIANAAKPSKPEGQIDSPYEACKNVVIVSKSQYDKSKSAWDEYGKCQAGGIQVSIDAGFTKINPLAEGVQYLDFSQKVAGKVLENLEKSKKYADCSASCFSGAVTCPASLSENNKVVQCSERKKEIEEGMKVYSRRIRMELALSTDSALVNINVRNALSESKEKFINTNLRDFEIGMPNPVGRTDLTAIEMKEALRRVDRDRKNLEDEYKEKGYKNYSDWMSAKLTQNFIEHRNKYNKLVYEDAPIFAVVNPPSKFDNDNNPVWDSKDIASAFKKLSENSKKTQEKVNWSLKNSALEFRRDNSEAALRWLGSLVPGTMEKNDLLFYIGMKNQVEEVLRKDPSSCATATALYNRLEGKSNQNAGMTIAGSILSGGLLKVGSSVVGTVARTGWSLSGASAAGITGLAMGGTFLGDSFKEFNSTSTEAATLSGLGGDKEGTNIRTSKEVVASREGVENSLLFAPLDAVGAWGVGKTLYSSLSKKMAKDLPEMAEVMKKASLDNVARDRVVDKWLGKKLSGAFDSGAITAADKKALETAQSRAVFEKITAELEVSNPDFFKNPKNMDFFFKAAATTVKKEKGDPSDLGEKAVSLLGNLNAQALEGSWDPKAQNGLLKVFDDAITELRIAAKEDPATYAKFNSDPEAQNKVLMKALVRSGVTKESDAKVMLQCALPGR